MKTTLDVWSDICYLLFPITSGSDYTAHPLHFCVINGQRHCVHAPDLPERDLAFYQRLTKYSEHNQLEMLPDRRTIGALQNDCRRRKLLPIVFFAFGVEKGQCELENKNVMNDLAVMNKNIEKITQAGGSHTNIATTHCSSSGQKRQAPLGAKQATATTADQTDINNIEASELLPTELLYDHVNSTVISAILRDHYVPQANDPKEIDNDIQAMSRYFSAHKEALKLISNVSHRTWELKYAPHTFQTDICGTRNSIKTVTVYFDPRRSAAKLQFYDALAQTTPFCVASQADALLHELLHVHSVYEVPATDMGSPSTGKHIYAGEHERQTILKENILYKAMSLRDNKPRPIRREHSGRHVLISYATHSNSPQA